MTRLYGPAVRCKLNLRSGSALLYPALAWSRSLLAIMDIRARPISFSDRPSKASWVTRGGAHRHSLNGHYGISANPRSLGLNVGRLDHLSPLIGIVDQEFPEVRWRQRHRDVSEAGDTFPKFWI